MGRLGGAVDLVYMEIIIGRDPETAQLRIETGGKLVRYGEAGSVSKSVSRQHCSIVMDVKGKMTVKNLKAENETFVNGRSVESKAVKEGDRIELGESKYAVDWKAIMSVMPVVADIRPLEKVWTDYQEQRLEQQIKERRFGTLRSATGLITMVAIALSMFSGRDSTIYLILYGAAILISLAFTVKAYRDSANAPRRMQELSDRFQRDYVCPKCGHFLGMQSYDILKQNEGCPYCKAKYRK